MGIIQEETEIVNDYFSARFAGSAARRLTSPVSGSVMVLGREKLRLMSYLNTLDDLTRVLFIRRYFYMDSVEMLARQFGMNASSVSTRLTRTRARLKAYLEREGIVL